MKTCDQLKRAVLTAVRDAKQHLTFDRAAPKLVSVVLTLEQRDFLLNLLQRIPDASKDHAP